MNQDEKNGYLLFYFMMLPSGFSGNIKSKVVRWELLTRVEKEI
jgi:hypothetical protein